MTTRHLPVDNRYAITGSREIFNRTLYCSHARDELPERYFTFAGELPLIISHASDCVGNTGTCSHDRTQIKSVDDKTMWLGASFPVKAEICSAAALETEIPRMFLAGNAIYNIFRNCKNAKTIFV